MSQMPRLSVLPLLILPWIALALLSGCGSAGSIAGTIDFGMSQSNHVVHQPRDAFGPNDTIAYVAHVRPRTPIPANTHLHEYFSRFDSKGHLTPVLNDAFSLKVPVRGFITLNSIRISELYRAGFTAPARYQIRLMHGSEQLATGVFSLK